MVILIVGLALVGTLFYTKDRELKIKEAEIKEKEAQQIEEKVDKESVQGQLDDCLADVSERFREFSNDPETRYQTSEGVKIVLDLYDKQKEDCFKRFPVD